MQIDFLVQMDSGPCRADPERRVMVADVILEDLERSWKWSASSTNQASELAERARLSTLLSRLFALVAVIPVIIIVWGAATAIV